MNKQDNILQKKKSDRATVDDVEGTKLLNI
jgi:hypothetical protein